MRFAQKKKTEAKQIQTVTGMDIGALLREALEQSKKEEEEECGLCIPEDVKSKLDEMPSGFKEMFLNAIGKGQGKGDSRTCYNCGKPGHLAKDCRLPPKGGGKGSYGGGKKGVGKGKGPMLCYNCGKPGHLAKDCRLGKGKGKGWGKPVNALGDGDGNGKGYGDREPSKLLSYPWSTHVPERLLHSTTDVEEETE